MIRIEGLTKSFADQLESLNRIIRDFEENPGRFLRELTLFRLF